MAKWTGLLGLGVGRTANLVTGLYSAFNTGPATLRPPTLSLILISHETTDGMECFG